MPPYRARSPTRQRSTNVTVKTAEAGGLIWLIAVKHFGKMIACNRRGLTVGQARLDRRSPLGIVGELGAPRETYEFHHSNMFDARAVFERQYDLMLCLGVLYHTARHVRLLGVIARTGGVIGHRGHRRSHVGGATIELKIERNDWLSNGSYAIDANQDRGWSPIPVARP